MAIEIPAAGGLRADVDSRAAQPGQWTTLSNVEMVVDGRFRLRSPFSQACDASAPNATAFVDSLSTGVAPWARAGGAFRFPSRPPVFAGDNPSFAVRAGEVASLFTASTAAHPALVLGSATVWRWIDTCSIDYFSDNLVCTFGISDTSTLTYSVIRASTGEVLYQGDVIDSTAFAASTTSLQVLPYGPDDLRVLICCSVGTAAYAFRLDMGTGATSTRRTWTVVTSHPISTCGVRTGSGIFLYITTRDAVGSVVTRSWDTSTENVTTVITSAVTLGTSWNISTSATVGGDGYPTLLECTCDVGNFGVIKRYGGVSLSLAATVSTSTSGTLGALQINRITAADTVGDGTLVVWTEIASTSLIHQSAVSSAGAWVGSSILGVGTLETHAQVTSAAPDGLGVTSMAVCGLALGDTSSLTWEAVMRWGAGPFGGTLCRGLFGYLLQFGTGFFAPDKTLHHAASFSSSVGVCVSPSVNAFSSRQASIIVGTVSGLNVTSDGTASAADNGGVAVHSGGAFMSDRSTLLPITHTSVPYTTAAFNAAGGTFPAGTYAVAVVYEWYDSRGIRYQSAPATRTLVAAGATSRLDVSVPYIYGTQLVVYCSVAGGATLYRAGVSTTTGTGPVLSIQITSAPAGTTETLYTLVEPPNIDPGHAQAVGIAGSRYWAASGTRVYYSKRAENGRAAQFAVGAFYLDCPERIYGIGELDEMPILLGATNAYRVVGDGPDATGGGGVYVLQPIAGTPGMVTSSPVLSSSVGVWYESNRGLTLLPRGGGPPVVQTAILLASELVSAVEDVAEERCLFSTLGFLYVYDYRTGAWCTWSASALRLGSYAGATMLSTGTRIYRQQAGDTSYADGNEAGSTTAYTLVAETGDLRPAGAAAPVQWGTVSTLTGSVGTSCTLSTTVRSDTDAGSVEAAAQTATITADRQKVRVQPQYAAADAISVRWELTPVSGRCADWCGVTIEATPQGGTTRVPSARSR